MITGHLDPQGFLFLQRAGFALGAEGLSSLVRVEGLGPKP